MRSVFGPRGFRLDSALWSDQLRLPARYTSGHNVPLAQMASFTGLASHAVLVAGRRRRAAGTRPGHRPDDHGPGERGVPGAEPVRCLRRAEPAARQRCHRRRRVSAENQSLREAFIVREHDGTWHDAQEVPGTGRAPFATRDNADSEYHAFAASEVNGTWGKAGEITGFSAFHGHDPAILSLSCGSPGNCSAVGTSGTAGPCASYQSANQGFVVSEQDGTWGEPELAPGIPVLAPRRGFVEFNPHRPERWQLGDCTAGARHLRARPGWRGQRGHGVLRLASSLQRRRLLLPQELPARVPVRRQPAVSPAGSC